MLTFDQAREQLLAAAPQAVTATMTLPVVQALGRVLASDVFAVCSMPPQDNSAMDGFALRCSDVCDGVALPVSQKIFAGHAPHPLEPGTAARLFTGSVVPEGADAVVLQEDCEYSDTQVCVKELPQPGQHIRRCGEDIRAWQLLAGKGTRLEPRHIGYLVAGGVLAVEVYNTLAVGLLATGDEIREPGATLAVGQIYNSNLYMLQAELQRLGFRVQARHVRDDVQLIAEAFAGLASTCDVLLSIGGVSVGEADFVKEAIGQLGALELWKVSMKPGKPLSFGHILGKPVIGLPGNPVSAFATFHLFAKPYLCRLQGMTVAAPEPRCYPVQLHKPLAPKREEFLRVRLESIGGEEWLVPYPHQGSGVLGSVVWASGFARIPQGQETASGARVAYIPF